MKGLRRAFYGTVGNRNMAKGMAGGFHARHDRISWVRLRAENRCAFLAKIDTTWSPASNFGSQATPDQAIVA